MATDDEKRDAEAAAADRAQTKRSEALAAAIHDRTHDKDGKPIPIVVPKSPQEG